MPADYSRPINWATIIMLDSNSIATTWQPLSPFMEASPKSYRHSSCTSILTYLFISFHRDRHIFHDTVRTSKTKRNTTHLSGLISSTCSKLASQKILEWSLCIYLHRWRLSYSITSRTQISKCSPKSPSPLKTTLDSLDQRHGSRSVRCRSLAHHTGSTSFAARVLVQGYENWEFILGGW
jgi:hypothetical protein